MATRGRSGTRPRRSTQTSIDRAPIAPEPAIADTAPAAGDAQLLDDTATTIAPSHARPLGRSLAGAVVGTVLVVGLAFGAALGPGGALGPTSDKTPAGDTAAANGNTAAGNGGKDGQDGGNAGDGWDHDGKGDGDWSSPESTTKPNDGGGVDPTDKPDSDVDPTDKPDEQVPDPTKKPEPAPDRTPKPTEKPDPKPDPTREPDGPIALELGIVEDHPKVAWGSCDGLDFDYYKVVRSKDSTVSFPAGDKDSVIAAVGPDGYRKAYDKDAPHGVKVWYRVFCVRKGEDGYKVVNASATKGIEVPEEPAPPPTPDPIDLSLDFTVSGEGKVVLSWSACDVDGFAFYKVVRSTWNDDPSYFPWTEGTDVIGVVEGLRETEWHDGAPDAGHAAYYRVQCLGYVGDHKVLLGESNVVTVTTPEA